MPKAAKGKTADHRDWAEESQAIGRRARAAARQLAAAGTAAKNAALRAMAAGLRDRRRPSS